MAITVPPTGSGTATPVVATDLVATDHYQLIKLAFGVAGAATMVSASNPLPVVQTGALPAGDNNIGDVDVLTVPAPLSTTGGGVEAAALRVTLANDSTGLLSVDDNDGSLTVDAPVAAPVFVRLSDGAAAVAPAKEAQLPAALVGGRLDVAVGAALPAGTNNIGDVDVLSMPDTVLSGTVTEDPGADPVSLPTLPQAVVSDFVEQFNPGELRSLSMTNDGRLRVSAAEPRYSVSFHDDDERSMWGDLETSLETQSSSPWGEW